MAKHKQEHVECRNCGHKRPITPNMKIQARGVNCARCGEPIPELQQYVVEEPKPVEQPVEPEKESDE